MVEDIGYSDLTNYLNDISRIPFATGPVNGNNTGFAKERTRRNMEFGTIVQRYLSTERILLERIEGLEEKIEPGAMLKIPKRYSREELVRKYKKELDSAKKLLDEHRRDNNSAYVQAKQGMAESCLLLVINWAKKYAKKSSLSVNDLIGYGNKGLMHATEKFDPKLGFQFSTYATYWIRQAMLRGIVDKQIHGDVSSSYSMHTKTKKIIKIENLLFSELGRKPNEEEIAKKYNKVYGLRNSKSKGVKDSIDADSVRTSRTARRVLRLSSLNYGENQDLDVKDNTELPYSIADRNEKYRRVLDYLDNSGNFSPNEREVVRYRFGLEGRNPRTLKETGAILRLTKERVRQIEERALHKLKFYLNPEYKE